MSPSTPTLRVERSLQREGYTLLAGMDEVGRGALAGPVSVGVVVIDDRTRTVPKGVRDSKLLSQAARERMVPKVRRWATAYAVGHSSAAEIDELGIMACLRLAGTRALAQLDIVPDLIILDGNHNWLIDPQRQGLLGLLDPPERPLPPVRTMIKADLKCSSVAAASVLAKVERDQMLAHMAQEFPHYGWAGNKGYSAKEHLDALDVHGPCVQHRRSWRRFATDTDVTSAQPQNENVRQA
ncbi:ribonuclease HII [Demetria terragena]|uniref:ribonuclease HII n=1 Tax=Demetria terragena TaxID=63959 RepID=UPI00035FD4E5|nr:ribonuclease HII [Demetria terragena]